MILFIAVEKNTEINEEQSRKYNNLETIKRNLFTILNMAQLSWSVRCFHTFFEVEVACTRNLYTNNTHRHRYTQSRALSLTLKHTYSDQTINHSIQYTTFNKYEYMEIHLKR